MIGKKLLHYKILEKLGEGGMGIVYKAEDTRLKREVAIKFLPRQIAASEEERERFKIEAQAAAALNHPNITHVYAIEEQDGEMFIVMQYIEGRELRSIIDDRQLSIDDVVDYSTQIACLQAAHKKGVTHRDIKSANIMITDKSLPRGTGGQVKIMDFRLAKIGGGAQLTKDHSTLGTAAYMSPEQARGEKVDHRTDIWAFGVVLAKDTEARYQNLSEVIAGLKTLTGLTPKSAADEPKPSIAVLPFANMSTDPEQEYFCDGMAEVIINALRRLENLHVAVRTSSFYFIWKKCLPWIP